MRKYLTPAMDMEAFDVEDIITVSGAMNQQNLDPNEGVFDNGETVVPGGAAAPIFVDFN